MTIPAGHKFVLAGGWTLPPVTVSQPELIRVSRHHKPEADKIWLDLPDVRSGAHPHAVPVTVADVMVGTIDELGEAFRKRLVAAAESQLDVFAQLNLSEARRRQIQAQLADEPVCIPLCKSHPFWRALDACNG